MVTCSVTISLQGEVLRKIYYVIDFGQASAGRSKRFDVQAVAQTIHSLVRQKPVITKKGTTVLKTEREVQDLIKYADSLDKNEEPDYKYMRNLMIRMLSRNKIHYNGRIEWPPSVREQLP